MAEELIMMRRMSDLTRRETRLMKDFDRFAAMVVGGDFRHVVVMFGGTTYIQDIRANRPIRLTRALAQQGVPVLFNYHRWERSGHIPPYKNELILQSPTDITPRLVRKLVSMPLGQTRGVLIISYPHPSACGLVNLANANGWATIYDTRDDWEAFSEVGMADWYLPPVERFVVWNCDLTCCVSRPLVDKLSAITDRRPVRLLPNAYDPAFRSTDYARRLGREKVIGYFGHLTGRWFDWESLCWIASQRPSYTFEIVGHGAPDGINAPPNLKLLGPKRHAEICALAARWHVGIIPFRIGQLSDGVDPIKIYEYFSLGLPVVSFRMPQIADYPHTTTVDTREAFVAALDRAIEDQGNEAEFDRYLAKNTWDVRAQQLLDWADDASDDRGCEKVLAIRRTRRSGSMKILYCYCYGILGGVCTQLINRLQAFRETGAIEMHMVFMQDHGISQTLAGYPHVHFEADPAKVRKLAQNGDYAAAVVVDTPEYLRALSDIPGLPLITEVHTTVEQGLDYLRSRSWSTAGYIVPSEYSRWLLREAFGIGRGQPVRVVPNSLDAKLFPRGVVMERPVRPIVAWVGKLDDHKNWRGFLAVAAEIVARGGDVDFWLIGGETAPQDRQVELTNEIDRLGIGDRVRWFPRIEYDAMYRMYATVRASGGVMLATTINESFGMSVLEAIVCGCPVLVPRVGALPEIMPGCSYVRLYDAGDTRQAADLAIEMIAPETAIELREAADADSERIAEKYSCKAVATRYVDVMRELIDRAHHCGSESAGGERNATAAIAAEGGSARALGEGCAGPASVAEEERNALLEDPLIRATMGGNGHSSSEELERAIRELRDRVPNGRWLPRDHAAFLRDFAKMLDQRSFQLARRLCESPRNRQFWLTLPHNMARILFRRRQ